MGQQQSKEELLYEQAAEGNIEAVKALCSEGAGLEWIDKEGKTALIVACLDPERYSVAKSLIELGGNVNAYRPGIHAGTPLHHAAKRGLELTVRLLLSHGANPVTRNDDCQTPLDVARLRGFSNVVRVIESHICFFSGWLREIYGPGFLEVFVLQWLSRNSWVVIVPCGSNNPLKPLNLELVIYSTLQDSQPRAVIALWKADIEEPKFHQIDPQLIIYDKSTKTRYKFASSNGDKQQIQLLYNACRGFPQHGNQTCTSQTAAEAVELALAINASIQSALENGLPLHPSNHSNAVDNNVNGWGNTTGDTSQNGGSFGESTPPEASSSGWGVQRTNNQWGVSESQSPSNPLQATNTPHMVGPVPTTNSTPVLVSSVPSARGSFGGSPPPEASSTRWMDLPTREEHNGWGVPESQATSSPIANNIPPAAQTTNAIPVLVSSAPSAPPIAVDDVLDEGPIHYPSIDFVEHETRISTSEANEGDGSSSCVICWEAPVEGACIPCGHMAGCMSCLSEIKTKKGDCPVCRAKINQVIRLYAV